MDPSFIYEAKGQTLIIHMPKELDHHNCRNLRYETDLLMAENYISKLIFDFSRTTFMDSSGIGIIIGRYKNITAFGGVASIAGAKPHVEKILKMAALDRIIPIYSDVNTALSKVGGGVIG